ncbi:serine O-acetyltransferase [Geoanaerobacter pelophilus]|uniref:serine O-acetyltransferase n=1 Tax=Geoanaerobacter pelophilus TaxID=60036 RepID=UPI000A268C1C|nr:hypothetical protein [Geoanaerobacter pelophilus]
MNCYDYIKEDIGSNKGNGVGTIFLLILYRMQRELLERQLVAHRSSFFWKLVRKLIFIPYRLLCHSYGCFLPVHARLGRRVIFKHSLYGIFISQQAVVGNDVVMLHQVTIGSNIDASNRISAPIVGDGVFIGAGAKLIGGITVGAGAKIGANAVVVTDIPARATVVLNKPRIIVQSDSESCC